MTDHSLAKRARANTAGDFHVSASLDSAAATQLRAKVLQLSHDKIIELAIRAAETIPDFHAMVSEAIREKQDEERNRVLDFDPYSKTIWKSLNVSYRSM